MNESSKTPQPSPAELLAAVLRVVAPHLRYETPAPHPGWVQGWHQSEDEDEGESLQVQYQAASLDSLARVVAMLDREQRRRLRVFLCKEMDLYHYPEELLTADPKTILAALVAATGVKA